jgi:predicted ABC-type transport system involved in lysophospholipase L1 biosynthesis ATPase subunit
MELLTSMQNQRSMTLLLVTHSSKVAAFARRTLVLEEGKFAHDSA